MREQRGPLVFTAIVLGTFLATVLWGIWFLNHLIWGG